MLFCCCIGDTKIFTFVLQLKICRALLFLLFTLIGFTCVDVCVRARVRACVHIVNMTTTIVHHLKCYTDVFHCYEVAWLLITNVIFSSLLTAVREYIDNRQNTTTLNTTCDISGSKNSISDITFLEGDDGLRKKYNGMPNIVTNIPTHLQKLVVWSHPGNQVNFSGVSSSVVRFSWVLMASTVAYTYDPRKANGTAFVRCAMQYDIRIAHVQLNRCK